MNSVKNSPGFARRTALAFAGAVLATAFAIPASAGEVTTQRLVNADQEPQN